MEFKVYFDFLNEVREMGVMNMFMAPKVLQEEFGLSKPEAMEVFLAWTNQFNLEAD